MVGEQLRKGRQRIENTDWAKTFLFALEEAFVNTWTIEQRQLVDGDLYRASWRGSLTAEQRFAFYYEGPEYDTIVTQPVVTAAGRCEIDTYKNVDIDTSTMSEAITTNMRTGSEKESDASVFVEKDKSFTDGELFSENFIPAAISGAPSGRIGGVSSGQVLSYVDSGDNLLFELENASNDTIEIAVNFGYYDPTEVAE